MISAAHQVHPPSPQLVQALEAASVLLEGLFYGGFVVLFLTNCYLRLSHGDKLRRGFRRLWCNAIVLPTLAVFATCTAHWAIDVILFFSTFLSSPVIFNQHAMHLKDANGCLSLATVLIVDGVIIHRLWVIWNRKTLVVALPIILWLGLLVDGVATLYLIIRGRMLAAVVSSGWVTASWALSSATNIYCTSLSAWRIWRTCHVAEDTKTKPFMSVLVVLVESAAIWTAWSTFTAVAIQTGSPLQPIASELMTPMAGIVNTLIYIRVGFLSRTRDGTTNPLPAMTDYASMVGVSVVPEFGTDTPSPYSSITDKMRDISGLGT